MYQKGVPPLALHNRLLPPPRGTPAQGYHPGSGSFMKRGLTAENAEGAEEGLGIIRQALCSVDAIVTAEDAESAEGQEDS